MDIYSEGNLENTDYFYPEIENKQITNVINDFMNKIEKVYHKNLRTEVKKKGGIIHTRISDTPLPKSKNK